MTDMPWSLPVDFQHREPFQQMGFVPRDFISPAQVQWSDIKEAAAAVIGGSEPTSVLDPRGSPSPPNSSSSLSCSANGGGGVHGGVSAFLTAQPPCATADGDVQFDQSMFGFISNDDNNNSHVDKSSELRTLISGATPLMPFSDLDSLHHQSGDEFGPFYGIGSGQCTVFGPFGNNESLLSQQQQLQPQTIESFINNHQQNPSRNSNQLLVSRFPDCPIFDLPNPKLVNTGSFFNPDQQLLLPQQNLLDQSQLQRRVLTVPRKIGMHPGRRMEEIEMNQQVIFEQIFKSAELVSMGNLVLSQGILARLNHQLSPIGKPLERVAYYFKESLQLLLHMCTNDMEFDNSVVTSMALSNFSPPLSLILKLGAFKLFSEISQIVQFENFTSNQVILEALDMYERMHIIDFDIGYGGQWASLMQELALRNCSGGMISLKITAFVSTYDDLELQLTRDNLNLFAEELNIDLDFNVFDMDMLNSVSRFAGLDDAIAVNLPIGIFSICALSLPFVLHVIKQLSPKIVVSLEKGCDRYDLPFAHNVIQAVQYYSTLLESLEAVSGNSDALQKMEKFMVHPMIEKLVLQRFRVQDKSPPSRSVFISSGYTPLQFSNFTESQGECLVERAPVRGFHIEKKHSSLALCWQQKELISVTAWRC